MDIFGASKVGYTYKLCKCKKILIVDWIPRERRTRGRLRKTWVEGVQVAMTTRKLEPDQWRNREEWRLVSGRRRKTG